MRKNPHGSSWSLTVCIFLGFYSFHDWCLFPPKANEKPAWKFFDLFSRAVCCKEEADIIWPNKNTTQNNPKKQKKRKRKTTPLYSVWATMSWKFFPMLSLPMDDTITQCFCTSESMRIRKWWPVWRWGPSFSCPYKRELQRLECIFRNGMRKKRLLNEFLSKTKCHRLCSSIAEADNSWK